jgi:alkaline phosphatase
MESPYKCDIGAGGISRRDMLKILGTGALYSLMPFSQASGSFSPFTPSESCGLIFVVGDGMSIGVIRAMHEMRVRYSGASGTTFYSRMKHEKTAMAYMGVNSLSSIVTDSAPASAAWATGSKTINRMLAALPDGRPLKTIMELAKERHYAVGLVTTTRVTHATPAAWISHQLNRDNEDNIALDYLKFKPDVLLGGGSAQFSSSKRKDGRDLFAEFAAAGFEIVRNRDQLLTLSGKPSDRPLLGAFNLSHISYYIDRLNDAELNKNQPTLAEMTAVALQRLFSNKKGFILQVEAGRIDHACHSNDALAAINETYELDMTLSVIDEYLRVNPNTLVIVTSDHGTAGFNINGTGADYNASTEALGKYLPVTGSFEIMGRKMKGKTAGEIKDIFAHYTSYALSDNESAMIYESLQPDYQPYPGDYTYLPDALLGRAMAHSVYGKNERGRETELLRRGNVGFTSTSHTAEDQIVIAYGLSARRLGIDRHIDNTYLFEAMCKFMKIKYKNPSMSESLSRSYIRGAASSNPERHMRLQIT